MGDTRETSIDAVLVAAPAGVDTPGSVGTTLTLSAEHLRGHHLIAHRHCWRCERDGRDTERSPATPVADAGAPR